MEYSDELVYAIREAGYGEWRGYLDSLEECGGVDTFIELVSPEVIRNILVNSYDNLTKLGMDIIKCIYREKYTGLDDSDRYRYMPSVDMQDSFLASLIVNSDMFETQFASYALNYSQLLNKMQSAKSLPRTCGGAVVGGVIGALFGPIGAVLGGLAGGAFSDGTANDELGIQAEMAQKAFTVLCDYIDRHIGGMVEVVLRNIDRYSHNLGFN